MSADIQITTSEVPSTFCHRTWPETWPFLVSLLEGTLEGNVQSVNFSSTTPAAEDRDKPLLKTNADGTPASAVWYSYASGNWLGKHPLVPGIVVMYEGSEASITALDGGEAATVTASTGPFWEKVTNMDAKFPIGPGTLPISGTVVAVGDTGGLEKVTLTASEMPAHTHNIRIGGADPTSGGSVIESAQTPDVPQGQKSTESSGSGDAHQNMPPYRAILFIRRTARLFYRL